MERDERTYFRKYIAPHLASHRLDKVRSADVEGVLADAVDKGLRRNTVRTIRAVLHRILDQAWRQEAIRENPVARTRVPKMREVRKARVILTDAEFFAFMACPKVDVEIKLMSLAARTLGGMRGSDVMR